MIITKNIVILNYPKTGSSFIRKVVKEIYRKRNSKNLLSAIYKRLNIGFKELLLPHPTIPDYKDQHGCFDQIPNKHKNKIILSAIRNPYLKLESIYRFKWWAKYPLLDKVELKTHFPNFPDLSFNQYLKLEKIENKKVKKKVNSIRDKRLDKRTKKSFFHRLKSKIS